MGRFFETRCSELYRLLVTVVIKSSKGNDGFVQFDSLLLLIGCPPELMVGHERDHSV